MFRARTVIRDPIFDQLVQALADDVERLDEMLDAIEWAVATRPEWYTEVPKTILRFILTDPFPGAPRMRVYFSIDDENTCTLRWIEYAHDPDAD